MGAHVSACDRTGYRTKGDVALWGTFGYELDPNKLSPEEKEIVKTQVAEYHKYYDLIRNGDLYRLICPWDDAFRSAWSFVSGDKNECLVTVVEMRKVQDAVFHLKLRGLDPGKYYINEADGETYSGALLMYAGVDLTQKLAGDGKSLKLYFRAK